MAIDTWSETCLIAIAAQGGSNVKFQAITETVDMDIGDKDFDIIATLAGGRLVKFTPQAETTITFEAYPLDAGTDTGIIGKGFFDLMNTADTNQPVQISADRIRNKYRVAIMWTTDTSITDATSAVTYSSTVQALRFVAADGYFISVKPSFTDGVQKVSVKFKVPAFDSAGSANIKMESISGTGVLAALAAYTTSVKW